MKIPGKTFYGWWVVLAAGIGLLLGFAPIFVFSFGVFAKFLAKDFRANRTQISLAFTLANLMIAVSSPLTGRLVDRFGGRRVIVPSLAIFGLLLICFKFISTSLWQLYVLFLSLGFIGSATAIPYGKVVSNWFDKKRGLALALTMIWIGVGAMIMPPITHHIMSLLGWRSTYALLGAIVLVVAVPTVAMFLKDSPEEMGLLPDGEVRATGRREAPSEVQGIPARVARTSSTFWIMASAFSLVGAGAHACVIHLVSMLTDRGITAQKAALASSALGIAFILGRVISGYFLDRIFAPRVAISFFIAVACGLALLSVGGAGAAAYVGASLIGFGLGSESDLMAYFTGRYFGLRFFGEISGYLFATFTLAGALGPLVMAVGFDRIGSYRAPLLFFLFCTIVATVSMMRIGPYRYGPSRQTDAIKVSAQGPDVGMA
jgi:MFS family permease